MGITNSRECVTKHMVESDGNQHIRYGVSAVQGWRPTMEDAHTALLDCTAPGSRASKSTIPKFSIFGVYDGHLGVGAAEYASEELWKLFLEYIGGPSSYSDGGDGYLSNSSSHRHSVAAQLDGQNETHEGKGKEKEKRFSMPYSSSESEFFRSSPKELDGDAGMGSGKLKSRRSSSKSHSSLPRRSNWRSKSTVSVFVHSHSRDLVSSSVSSSNSSDQIIQRSNTDFDHDKILEEFGGDGDVDGNSIARALEMAFLSADIAYFDTLLRLEEEKEETEREGEVAAASTDAIGIEKKIDELSASIKSWGLVRSISAAASSILSLSSKAPQMPKVHVAEVPGTTALMVVVTESSILCANAGDSRAVLARVCSGEDGEGEECQHEDKDEKEGKEKESKKLYAVQMSRDHKPTLADEWRRIRGAKRSVHLGRIDGRLAVSRGLGDYSFKANYAGGVYDKVMHDSEQAVSPSPEISVFDRTQNDAFIILACDGLWDVCSSEVAVKMTSEYLIKHNGDAALAAEELCNLALMTGSPDNVSVVVVVLNQWLDGDGGKWGAQVKREWRMLESDSEEEGEEEAE